MKSNQVPFQSASVKSVLCRYQSRWRLPAIQLLGLAGISFLAAAAPALAHHGMGKSTPSSFFEGFVSGLAHPVIGLDHLAFVVAIGLISVGRARGAFIPVAFLIAAMAGTGVHLLEFDLPAAEIAVAISVIAGGLLLLSKKGVNLSVLAALATLAGLFHGYAYGESIVGAEMTPLLAYLVGFTAVQWGIAMLALRIGNLLANQATKHANRLLRIAGYVTCIIGTTFLFSAIGR